MKIELEVRNMLTLSASETRSIGRLKVSDWQEIKGGSFEESLQAWQEDTTGHVLGLCFLVDDEPVGMTLFKRPPLSPTWASKDAATIHGLKITTPWQGRGLGHEAFELGVNQLKLEWPLITTLMLAVDADNDAALSVYRNYGMTDSGPIYEGNAGPENRFFISLKT